MNAEIIIRNKYRPTRCGFLLIPGYTMLSFTAAVEALAMANALTDSDLYTWSILTQEDQPVHCSNGVRIDASDPSSSAEHLDVLFVCGGIQVQQRWNPRLGQFLRQVSDRDVSLGAFCTGTYLLAKAGVLDNHRCTIHWENLLSLREEFPRLKVSDELFEVDRGRYTCTGGTASMDLMIYLIEKDYGRKLATCIAEQFTIEPTLAFGQVKQFSVRNLVPGLPDYLAEAVLLMQNNVEEPLLVKDIANLLGVSTRHIERGFRRYFRQSPLIYYRNLRLEKGRHILRNSQLAVSEVALACGFKSTQHFSHSYRNYFQVRPNRDRQAYVPQT